MADVGRRQVLVAGGLAVAAAVLGACTRSTGPSSSPGPGATAPTTAGTPHATTAPAAPSPSPTSSPPVEVMVGQMLMLGFRGTELTAGNPVVGDLTDRHVGAVALFSRDVPSGSAVRNIASPSQVARLTAALQEAAPGQLLVATDEEGGRVVRLGPEHGFPATRSAAELGAQGDPGVTRSAAAAMARTLRDAGVNLNLAPVVDVNVYPANPIIGALGRSFSADPEVVAEQAAAFVEGHRDVGVLTCLKHFPGHGSSHGDTHAGFVDVTRTWSPAELVPYRRLIPAGVADAVMVAHVVNAHLDPDRPASLSAATITGLLREELGFDGVVVSDDLQMGAITQGWTFEEAIRLAVLAGTDILTLSNNLDTFDPGLGRRAYETLLGLVEKGDVTEERLAQSYRRIQGLVSRVR